MLIGRWFHERKLGDTLSTSSYFNHVAAKIGRLAPSWVLALALVWQVASSVKPLAAGPDLEAQIQKHYQVARDAEKRGDLDKAATEYLAVLEIRPGEPLILNNLGLVYHLQGKYREAIETLQQAVRHSPELLGARLFLGIDYYRTNQPEKALTHLNKAIALSPKDKQAHLYLGRCYLELGQFDDALKEVGAASQIDPEDVDVLYTLGQVYAKLLSSTYGKLAKIAPDSYRVHQVLAESYTAQKNMDKAIQEYKAAISRRPNTPGLFYGLGDVYWRAGRLEDAKREFREELKINPENYLAIWKIGDIYLFQSRWDDAIPYLEKAIQLRPELGQAHRDLGKAYFQKNELDKAIVEFKKVAELAPDEDTVHYRLATIYKKLGRKADADAELKIFEALNTKAQAARNPLLPEVTPEEQE
jgi:tetratricopeptide (TPR) repeat protein